MPRRQLVFGYGSLAGDLDGTVAVLPGHRRVWGVAMDNSADLPGYKHYQLRADSSRPRIYVAFLDLAQDAASAVNGVLRPVDETALRELDRRERNYDRVDVTGALEGVSGTVWTYLGSAAGRARLRDARERRVAVVSREYLADVRAGFAALSAHQLAAFESSSDLGGLPIWDLERISHGA